MSGTTPKRRALLAQVHIAKKQLGLSDSQYDAVLSGFKAQSAKDLTDFQLRKLVAYFKHLGWKARPSEKSRLHELRRRVTEAAGQIPNGANRLPGLTRSICGTDRLEWCRDEGKLRRLLAVIGQQKRAEGGR